MGPLRQALLMVARDMQPVEDVPAGEGEGEGEAEVRDFKLLLIQVGIRALGTQSRG